MLQSQQMSSLFEALLLPSWYLVQTRNMLQSQQSSEAPTACPAGMLQYYKPVIRSAPDYACPVCMAVKRQLCDNKIACIILYDSGYCKLLPVLRTMNCSVPCWTSNQH
jgi:hypothetical protein